MELKSFALRNGNTCYCGGNRGLLFIMKTLKTLEGKLILWKR